MTPESIERELEIQGKHVMARADAFESWEQYRDEHAVELRWFDAEQIEKLETLFRKHHSLAGFVAG